MPPAQLVEAKNAPPVADGTATESPKLDGPEPRTARITSAGVTTLAIVAILFSLAGTAWFGLRAKHELDRRAALRQGSVQTLGEIARLYYPGQSNNLWVQYTFPVDDTIYAGKAVVPDKFASALRGTDVLEIRYVPDNPAVNHPADWEQTTFSSFTPLFLPAAPGIFAMLLLAQVRVQRRLRAQRTLAFAVSTKRSRARNNFRLMYKFHTKGAVAPSGRNQSEARMEPGA
jgi:hypothetical protein